MARRRIGAGERYTKLQPPNPEGPEERSPYPKEPKLRNSGHTSTGGPNMYGQQNQTNRGSTRMPWPEGAPSDSDGWESTRANIRKNMNKDGRSY